jgi:hypothetical protein
VAELRTTGRVVRAYTADFRTVAAIRSCNFMLRAPGCARLLVSPVMARPHVSDFSAADRHGSKSNQSFRTRVAAFLSHGTLHKQYRERDRKGQHDHHPEGVEISKRRRLLLAQVFELLPSKLLRRGRIAGLLKEERLGLRDEGIGRRIEGIKIRAKSKHVELITPLLEGLGQRRNSVVGDPPRQDRHAAGSANEERQRICKVPKGEVWDKIPGRATC